MFKVQSLKKLLRLPGEGREPGINKYWMPVYTGMTDSGGSPCVPYNCHSRVGLAGIQDRLSPCASLRG